MSYLLIDLSYYNFYRFYAIKQWYTRAHPEDKFEDDYDWSKNTLFYEKFKKLYLETLSTFQKKFKPSKIILCRDCPRSTIWRMSIFSEYKGTRDLNNKNFTGGKNIFEKIYSEIIPEILEKNKNMDMICAPQLEADDLIYLTIKNINESTTINKPEIIRVISSDNDLLQIVGEFDNVDLLDAKMKSYKEKAGKTRDETLLKKIILGDTSDNIPKAFKKVGEKTAQILIDNPEKLMDKLKEDKDGFEQFAKNKLLVDFHYIPEELQENYKNSIFNMLGF
jgi:hypothetical protein